MTYSIRPPGSAELPMVHHWLPQARQSPGTVCGLVATDDLTGRLLGAVTLSALEDRPGEHVGGLLVYVASEARRRGVGTALVRSAYGVALETGLPRVATLDVVDEEVASFFAAAGMSPVLELSIFETPLGVILNSLEPRYERLIAGGHGPRLEEVRPLAEIRTADALRFVDEHAGALVGTSATRLEGDYYCRQASSGLVRGERLEGLLLGRATPTTGYIELLVIAGPQRGSAAELVLMLAAARQAQRQGMQSVVFEADPVRHVLTTRLAERWKARVLGKRYTFSISREAYARLALHSDAWERR